MLTIVNFTHNYNYTPSKLPYNLFSHPYPCLCLYHIVKTQIIKAVFQNIAPKIHSVFLS